MKLKQIPHATVKRMGFYSTYEELKQFFGFDEKNQLNSFYSTYEELKLAFFNSSIPEIGCFYSTYEELKQETRAVAE